MIFNLALSFGLSADPVAALGRAIGYVEATAERGGVETPSSEHGLSDGERLWAVRYSSEGKSRTLFSSTDAASVRRLHPENERLQRLRDEDHRGIPSRSPTCGVWESIPRRRC